MNLVSERTCVGPQWSLGDRLRKVRRDVAGISQAEMAELLEVPTPTYGTWEGNRALPNRRVAEWVARRVEETFPGQVSASWVLGLDTIGAGTEVLLPRMDSNHQPCDWRSHNRNALLGNVFGSVKIEPPSA